MSRTVIPIRPLSLVAAFLLALLLVLGAVPTALADSAHVVRPGETMTSIAQQHGVTPQALAATNGLQWNSWVYAGQTLMVPDGSGTPVAPVQAATGGSYVVKPGDTLYGIALSHGTTVPTLMSANGLTTTTIYSGQRLVVSGASVPAAAQPVPSSAGRTGDKWIDVNLTTQTITAYQGQRAIYSAVVSTGLPRTPTVVGTFPIYVKYAQTDMRGGSYAAGDYYYLRNVPYTMYFYQGYGIHGTYWHNNFGQPMSHGCVNLRTSDAEWFFNWAEIGTLVVSHY